MGAAGLASATAPLAEAVGATLGFPANPWSRARRSLRLARCLLIEVSRTTLAMARDRHLPHPLAAVHPRFGDRTAPNWWSVSSSRSVAALVGVRGAIGFSSFAVLLYYAM